ncbi:hypothetical protein GBAR_LOCUS25493 [Geodia barretti]|uniref:Uncharacterized protein n=1 Tax=Geodia barretti TaxID=519541 RepID=A0AA35X6K3_GEOBA|nr:hypothetical protein GBAR_LOCUS25493 [Geodia barretti]
MEEEVEVEPETRAVGREDEWALPGTLRGATSLTDADCVPPCGGTEDERAGAGGQGLDEFEGTGGGTAASEDTEELECRTPDEAEAAEEGGVDV